MKQKNFYLFLLHQFIKNELQSDSPVGKLLKQTGEMRCRHYLMEIGFGSVFLFSRHVIANAFLLMSLLVG